MAPNGSNWLQIALKGSKRLQMTPNGSKWLEQAQKGSKWLQMGQNGSTNQLVNIQQYLSQAKMKYKNFVMYCIKIINFTYI